MEIIGRVMGWEAGGGEWGKRYKETRRTTGRYKIDRGMLRIVQEM